MKTPNENLKGVNFVLVDNKSIKPKRKIPYGKYIEIILIIALVVFLLVFFLEQFFCEGTFWIPILY